MTKQKITWLIGIVAGIVLLCIADRFFKPTKPIENIRNRTSEIIDSLDVARTKNEAAKYDSLANYYMQKVDSIKKTKTKLKIAYIEIKKDTTATDSAKLSLCDKTLEESEKENELKDKVIEAKDSSITKKDETINKQSLVIINLDRDKNILYSDNKKLKSNQKPPILRQIVDYAAMAAFGAGTAILLNR